MLVGAANALEQNTGPMESSQSFYAIPPGASGPPGTGLPMYVTPPIHSEGSVGAELMKLERCLVEHIDANTRRLIMCRMAEILVVNRLDVGRALLLLKEATTGIYGTHDPNLIAWVRVLQGMAWLQLGDIGEAIGFLLVALHAYDADFCRIQWARIHNLLGDAYRRLAACESRSENIRRAIIHFTFAANTLHPREQRYGWRRALMSSVECYNDLWLWELKRNLYESLLLFLEQQEKRTLGDVENTMLVQGLKGSCGGGKTRQEHVYELQAIISVLNDNYAPESHQKAMRCRLAVLYVKDLWETEKGLAVLDQLIGSLANETKPEAVYMCNWARCWTGSHRESNCGDGVCTAVLGEAGR